MKSCPTCQSVYADEALDFCRGDGALLVSSSPPLAETAAETAATWTFPASRPSAETHVGAIPGTPSIAVLPFVNMSSDPENEFFCDGLAEELINALTKVEQMRVVARTSAFSFKGKDAHISRIGQALSVNTVLEGSVRRVGDRLRITAQLIDVADGFHLWSERYDRRLEDVFEIQDDLSLAIVGALRIKLLGEKKAAVLKHYTADAETYQLYLRGIYHYHRWTEEGYRKAIECFRQVTENEPNHAPAHARLAGAYSQQHFFGHAPPREIVSEWRSAALKALEIDASLAEAHLAVALFKFNYEWDWAGAEESFRKAIELNPNHAATHEFFPFLLLALGRFEEAVAEGRRACELDPRSLVGNLNTGWAYWPTGQYDRLIENGRGLLALDPNFFGGHWQAGVGYWLQGKYEEALAEYQRALALSPIPLVRSQLGAIYGLSGRRDMARRVLGELRELRERRYVPAFDIALVHAGLGETDEAFAWLGKAYEERNGELVHLRFFPRPFSDLAADPRFTQLLRSMRVPTSGAPPHARRQLTANTSLMELESVGGGRT
ncbi:MAG TPA: tetratricopeptide repeat protein [Pyrinomonadaceae bacterium]